MALNKCDICGQEHLGLMKNCSIHDNIKPQQGKDRPWSDYPLGTKAYAVDGSYWTKHDQGWRWSGNGYVHPEPGCDVERVELPDANAIEKQPVGLRPRDIAEALFKQDRVVEIQDAIARYQEAGRVVPQDWVDELGELEIELDPYSGFKAALAEGFRIGFKQGLPDGGTQLISSDCGVPGEIHFSYSPDRYEIVGADEEVGPLTYTNPMDSGGFVKLKWTRCAFTGKLSVEVVE